jgi:hypothetical protein
VYLQKGQRLFARVTPEITGIVRMSVWAPGTQRVDGLDGRRLLVAQSRSAGVQARVGYRATQTGRYYLELKLARPTHDPLVYRLAVARG